MLEVEAPGIDALRRQADSAIVVGKCPCGCATIYLAVEDPAATESSFRGVIRGGMRRDLARPDYWWGLILFARGGWLESLEVWGEDGSGAGAPRDFPFPDGVSSVHI